jgi:hypothetical protein
MVVHVCNPSYLESRDWGNLSPKPASGNRPYLKNNQSKNRAEGVL